ncbi:hypothetical protein [Micromonospora maritima]|uniref:hypothetical protein n=1 Tax=Micromonospora maritima TaxID=986711 RepID=UPI0031EF79AA
MRLDLLEAAVPAAADVRADLVDREQLGIERYGTFLQAFNGRDCLLDAYQELLDLAVYLKQALVEGWAQLEIMYYAALAMAMHLKEEMQARDAAQSAAGSAARERAEEPPIDAADDTPQHPQYLAVRAAVNGPLRAVVEHHRPHPVMRDRPEQIAYWQCHGCDQGPRPEDLPDAPCSTIELIAELIEAGTRRSAPPRGAGDAAV